MTWRRVGLIYLVLGALSLAFVTLEGTSSAPPPPAVRPAAEQSLLGTATEAVIAVTFHRGGVVVRAERDGGRWRVVEPGGAGVASDLIAAAVATLTAGQVAEVMREGRDLDLAAFGLAEPSSEIDVEVGDGTRRRVRVLLGARNPTKTAVYARRDDRAAVYLVGLNVRYYEDLIFEGASAHRDRRANAAQ